MATTDQRFKSLEDKIEALTKSMEGVSAMATKVEEFSASLDDIKTRVPEKKPEDPAPAAPTTPPAQPAPTAAFDQNAFFTKLGETLDSQNKQVVEAINEIKTAKTGGEQEGGSDPGSPNPEAATTLDPKKLNRTEFVTARFDEFRKALPSTAPLTTASVKAVEGSAAIEWDKANSPT